jgi:hypothetical protein
VNTGPLKWALAATATAVASVAHATPRDVTSKAAMNRATLAMLVGVWGGHQRRLTITRSGWAKESIGSGCCNPVVDLRLKLSRPRGDNHVASVIVRVTSVQIQDRSVYDSSYPAPYVGKTGRLRLRYGVITETVTRMNYCNKAAQAKGRCGA